MRQPKRHHSGGVQNWEKEIKHIKMGNETRPEIESGLLVFGCGLPRTGTTSTRRALEVLLGGKCYHGSDVVRDPRDAVDFWSRAERGEVTKRDWDAFLPGKGYVAGIDFPVALFYKCVFTYGTISGLRTSYIPSIFASTDMGMNACFLGNTLI